MARNKSTNISFDGDDQRRSFLVDFVVELVHVLFVEIRVEQELHRLDSRCLQKGSDLLASDADVGENLLRVGGDFRVLGVLCRHRHSLVSCRDSERVELFVASFAQARSAPLAPHLRDPVVAVFTRERHVAADVGGKYVDCMKFSVALCKEGERHAQFIKKWGKG